MRRGLAAALSVILVVLPALAVPSWPSLGAAALATAVLTGAILALSVPMLAVGIFVTLVGYTLALCVTSGLPDAVTATALGMTIALLVQVVDFARRVGGVAVSPDAMAAQIRYWLRSTILTGVGTAIVGALGLGLSTVLPPLAAPVLAVAGALAVIAGAASVAAGRLSGQGSH
jgi:hypothetical protein